MVRVAGWVSLAVLLAGIGVATWQWRRNAASPSPQSEPTPVSSEVLEQADETAVEQALRQQPVTTDDDRARWVADVRGIDISALSPRQRDVFVRFANAERCTCGCGYSLAGCRSYDPTCEISGPILVALRDSVARGLVASVAHLRRPPAPNARTVDR